MELQDLHEVRVLKDADVALERYCYAYEKRYGVRPIINNDGSDRRLLKEIRILVGHERLLNLIDHYLKMDHDWFIKNAHSLHVLKKDINIVNAAIGINTPKLAPKGTMLKELLWCDNTDHIRLEGKYSSFVRAYPLNHNWDERMLCDDCLSKGIV